MALGNEVYLDNQATTACDPRVVSAMLPWFTTEYGNAASEEHAAGRRALAAVEQARREIAALIGAEAREIVLTSGATEANNLAIKGYARQARALGDPRRRLITVATEHKCVLASMGDLAAEGFEPVLLPVRADGTLDQAALSSALATPTLLVSVMAANNEVGVLHDIASLAAIAHRHGAAVHSDLAQAAGKLPIDVAAWGIELASLSAHKLYGPKGVGALYVRRRPRTRLAPLLSGGGQERGLRSGTLPVPLIVGFGVAAAVAGQEMAEESARVTTLRDRLLAALRSAIPGLRVNGPLEGRLPGNLNVMFPDRDGAALMTACPLLCVSSGSACSVATLETSHVLRALGLSDDEARGSLRLGVGRFNSAADIDRAAAMLAEAYAASGSRQRSPYPVQVAVEA